jgi:hypothetical protein
MARQEVTQGGTMAVQLQWAMAATAGWTVGWRRDRDGRWWQQCVTAGVAMGDGKSGGKIAMVTTVVAQRTAGKRRSYGNCHEQQWQQWETAMAAARLQWAMVVAVQWTAGWQFDCNGNGGWWREGNMVEDGNGGGTITTGNGGGGTMGSGATA